MDYEKLHKDTINKLQQMVNSGKITVETACGICADFVPESDDERIRKELIDFLEYYRLNNVLDSKTISLLTDSVAWLEKQGNKEYVLKSSKDKDFVRKFVQCIEKEAKAYEINLPNRGYDIYAFAKDILTWIEEQIGHLEKQGEQKLVKCNTEWYDFVRWFVKERTNNYTLIPSDADIHTWGGIILEHAKKELEKQGKQKPIDKVESKFKIEEGKWYICTQTYVLRGKIIVIKGQTYQVEKDNVIKGEDGCLFIDRHDGKASDYFRLWTIQDAKDGDLIYVSTEEKGIQAIFHEYKNDTIFFHCYLCADFVQGGYMPIGSVELVYPLQKTHYNRFFEKMKEAGYEWDAEKKDLKKIVAPIFHIGNRVRYKGHKCDGVITEITNTDYICGDAKLPISTQDKLELVEQNPAEVRTGYWNVQYAEQKPTDNEMKEILRTEYEKGRADAITEFQKEWSEEDEKILNLIIARLHSHPNVEVEEYGKDYHWLKVLKNRVQLQNGYNPYKEVVESIAEMCKHYDKASHSGLRDFYDNVKVKCKDAKEYESLFPQTTWKPSDEQITWLYRAADDASKDSRMKQVLNELLSDLKKLKEEKKLS